MEFAVLPDCSHASVLVDRLPCDRRIDHASGRPWIVGSWADEELFLASAGNRRCAVFTDIDIADFAARVDAAAVSQLSSPYQAAGSFERGRRRVEVIGASAGAARRRLGVVGAVSPWQQASAASTGCLLVPGLAAVSINTSWPLG